MRIPASGSPRERRQLAAQDVRHLRRGPQLERLQPWRVRGDRRSPLHREPCHTVDAKAIAKHDLGGGDGRLDVGAARVRDQEVRLQHVLELRSTGFESLDRVDDVRQDVVLDLDEVEGILGDVPIRRDDGDDRLSLPERDVTRHREERERRDARERPEDGERLSPPHDVVAGENGRHPVEREGTGRVDAENPRSRERAPADRHVKRPRRLDVVDEPAETTQETLVFVTMQPLADPGTRARGRNRCRRHLDHLRHVAPILVSRYCSAAATMLV